jgi:hypothetical protein
MRRIRTAAAVSLALAGFISQAAAQNLPNAKAEEIGLPIEPAAVQEDGADVLRVVQAFLDAINTRDTAAYRALVLAEVKNLIIFPQADSVVYRWRSTEESLYNLGSEGPGLLERIWEAEVRVNGPIAAVWSPYDFYVDGAFSHCGIDAFQLVRSDAGWRIGAIAYTVIREKEKCPPSPLGPP